MFKRWITRFHLWAGLILGIQVFIWMLSGFTFSILHINDVRGTSFKNEYATPVFHYDQMQLSLKEILAQHAHHDGTSHHGAI